MGKSSIFITGISMPNKGFRIHETYKKIDITSVSKVLNGELAAYCIHDFLEIEQCTKIVENFWNCPKKSARYGVGEDGVEGYFIGASHIEKTTEKYLQEAQDYASAIENLYLNTINPLDKFRKSLLTNSHYTNVRPAQHNGLLAGNSKAVYWNNLGNFLLEPHDDLAQLSDPLQNGFEIQQATRVMAINFYPQVPKNTGQLKIWNIEPYQKARDELNLTYSGFPYPAELLTEFQNLIIPVQTGDLCVINGNLIHAVIRGSNNSLPKDRLLISCFMTYNSNNELIWWT